MFFATKHPFWVGVHLDLQRLGIVKIALESGASLVPVYGFGHSELWTKLLESWSRSGARMDEGKRGISSSQELVMVNQYWLLTIVVDSDGQYWEISETRIVVHHGHWLIVMVNDG